MNARTTSPERSRRSLIAVAALLVAAMVAAACGSDDGDTAGDAGEDVAGETAAGSDEEEPSGPSESAEGDGTDADDDSDDTARATSSGYPREIETTAGPVTVPAPPQRIVSLSPTATEILFAIDAGELVVAVDLFSNHPAEAPTGTLDGFVPDLEAILSEEPDLVVASGLPEDVAAGLADSGVPVILQPAALSFDDTYDQIAQLGEATDRIDEAAAVNGEIRQGIEAVLANLPDSDEPVRVFHEIDDSFYTATSDSFIGQVYATMGFENIADPLDDGTGFPLVDGESIIAADPTLIVFTSQAGYERDDIVARPGWETVTAVASDNVVEVDADIASRWGPRIVEFMEAVAAVLAPVDA